ncbi:M13 family metallopeptidase [Miniphocaeibacter halophilus]|uniref:M13 family metallopeptidase n=1 Tax=Miniphocaeibacter halophilus TaxID=2931922 RepID=A0AC61MSV8_9FIRM|nr:M13 family metallopeptidase [Miniphocaeibacter halophilus]QQK08784.1 M13 family metallopeptidase [Miniphocaeibacter halophilus]
MKKKLYKLISLLLVVSMFFTACNKKESNEETKGEELGERPRLEDDFYEYVNYDWLKNNEIPADKASIGYMEQIQENIDANLKEELDKLLKVENIEDPIKNEMIKLYKMLLDFDNIDKLGTKPLEPYLKDIEKIQTIEDLNNSLIDWQNGLNIQNTILEFSIDTNTKDVTKKSIYLGFASSMLPDKSLYEKDNEQGEQILELYKEAMSKVLTKFGLNEKDAERKVENMLAVDRRIAESELTAEEYSDDEKSYNLVSKEDLESKYKSSLDLVRIMKETMPVESDSIEVTDINMLSNLDKIFDPEKLEETKDWLYVSTIISKKQLLPNDIRGIMIEFENTISGTVPKENEREEAVFKIINDTFGFALGEIYVENNFSQKAKEDVEEMTKNIIEKYKERLKNNEWLSEETKAGALKKLDSMAIKIGYPEKLPEYYSLYKIDENKDIIENMALLGKVDKEYSIAKFDEPVDRSEWEMKPQELNAYYSPSSNDINFPAGILQAPFYSLEQTVSENYGGIGVVIGHEMSHAFDTNGSLYDEIGNMRNWWTEKDYEEFQKKADKVIESFDGLDYMGEKINGKLTVSENIADLSGIAVSLEVAKTEKDFNAKEYFENYANIWAGKTRPELIKIQLATDEHSPNKARVNNQVVNFDEFFETYNIKKGDKMWREKEDRLSVW